MDCRDCPRYDPENRRCRDGKLNPPRYSDAVEVANVWGVRAICAYNDHRPRLVSVRTCDGKSAAPQNKKRTRLH
ncbi:MAG TPA: hypothetical protein VNI20_08535 [Fimbriimonadaceae bacterium]|nr:hypothetical protein [Fimbriimonadaceae bacterium]